jgi:hypothetical protein
LSEIPVSRVLAVVRAAGEDSFVKLESLRLPTSVDTVIRSMEDAMEAATTPLSLADMVRGDGPPAPSANDRKEA